MSDGELTRLEVLLKMLSYMDNPAKLTTSKGVERNRSRSDGEEE
jgi:hypothetical protein